MTATIYVTTQQLRAKGIGLSTFPNAGPNPNITGMKLHYWGKDAYCLKHGRYVYKVPYEVYAMFANK